MRTSSFLAAAATLLALGTAACKARDEEPQHLNALRPQIIKDIPVLPGAIVTDTTGSEDAERRSYLSQVVFDSVRSYYRTMLPAQGWAIIGDRGDSMELDLYTRKGSQTLWVHLKRLGDRATEYTLIANGQQTVQAAPAAGDTAR